MPSALLTVLVMAAREIGLGCTCMLRYKASWMILGMEELI